MSTKAPQAKRLLFVDTLRGLAVLYMIQLHTSHGWLQRAAQTGRAWESSQFFGGLAAPLFLMLAGAGLGLQWSGPRPDAGADEREKKEAKQGLRLGSGSLVRGTGDAPSDRRTAGAPLPLGRTSSTARPNSTSTRRSIARGLELVLFGYVLRLQMWVIDGAAYSRLETYPALALLAVGYALALRGVSRLAQGRSMPAWASWTVAGVSIAVAGSRWAYAVDPSRADGLVRVDVLQCIGASLLLLSAVGARAQHRRVSVFVVIAVGCALATVGLQHAIPAAIPYAFSAYVAQAADSVGQRGLALFPLFPWLSYAATGVALGLLWGHARCIERLESRLVVVVAISAVMALLTNGSWAPMRWLETPLPVMFALRVAYKTALCLVMLGPALMLTYAPRLISAPLQLLGRTSLLVYWVHLEFAFGTLSRPVAGALGTIDWAYGTLVLGACMWALGALRSSGHSYWIAVWRGRPATG